MSGEISTHVISKLGKPSVAGATVCVYYHANFDAGARADGWESLSCAQLSENGGNDALVPPGQLKRGLYLVEYDFTGVDAAARRIYKKEGADYLPLNPTGFFLASRTSITLKARAPSPRSLSLSAYL